MVSFELKLFLLERQEFMRLDPWTFRKEIPGASTLKQKNQALNKALPARCRITMGVFLRLADVSWRQDVRAVLAYLRPGRR